MTSGPGRHLRLVAAGVAAALALGGSACFADDEDERRATPRPAACAPKLGSIAGEPASASEASRRPILFWRERPWPSLWSVRGPDGSQLRRIYITRQNAKRPSLSPDGEWIAFDGASPGKPPLTDFDVQIVRRDGTGRRTLAGSALRELDAAWSPDGRRLSFSRYKSSSSPDAWLQSQIWVVGVDGSKPTGLGLGYTPRWSPDGKMLVFAAPTPGSDGDLFVMNADGSGRCRLHATPQQELAAGWSPDGRKLLFTRYGPDGSDVFVMNVDGSGVRNLTRAAGFDAAAAWSPDGSKVLFVVGQRAGQSEIHVMDADGSNMRSISGTRFDGSDPSW